MFEQTLSGLVKGRVRRARQIKARILDECLDTGMDPLTKRATHGPTLPDTGGGDLLDVLRKRHPCDGGSPLDPFTELVLELGENHGPRKNNEARSLEERCQLLGRVCVEARLQNSGEGVQPDQKRPPPP